MMLPYVFFLIRNEILISSSLTKRMKVNSVWVGDILKALDVHNNVGQLSSTPKKFKGREKLKSDTKICERFCKRDIFVTNVNNIIILIYENHPLFHLKRIVYLPIAWDMRLWQICRRMRMK